MATSDKDNDVDGDGAMGDDDNDDGDGATGDDDDDDNDGDGDGAMGSGTTGYDDDDNDDDDDGDNDDEGDGDQRKLQGAKPKHTSCPDQAAPGCPRSIRSIGLQTAVKMKSTGTQTSLPPTPTDSRPVRIRRPPSALKEYEYKAY